MTRSFCEGFTRQKRLACSARICRAESSMAAMSLRQHAPHRDVQRSADMLRHQFAVAGYDLHCHAAVRQRRQRCRGARLWRIEKSCKTGKDQIRFIATTA